MTHKLLPDAEKEIVQLAAAEGHDAEIPSNAGYVTSSGELERIHSRSLSKIASSAKSLRANGNKEIDVEKEASSRPHSESGDEGDGEGEGVEEQEVDPNIVTWDGDDDPENPMNWPSARKWGSICVVSALTFLTPLGSSIFAPGVPQVMVEFHSNSELLEGFIVSVYVLGFAFGPLIIAPMSEMWGRLKLYHSCSFLFLVCTIICAVSKNMNMLIVFRFLAGSVGAAPLALGAGTIADLIKREQRATAMAVWVLGPTVGPVLGPVAGGFISEYLGWRWNFWIIAIATGVIMVSTWFLMKETYAPAILASKTKRLREETGNPNLRSALDSGLTPRDLFWFSIVRPTKMLLFSPIVLSLSTYVALVYAYLYLLFTTITEVFEEVYHFRPDLVGLAFLGIGTGSFFGQFAYTWLANRSYARHVAKGDLKPEHRLEFMGPGSLFVPIGLFWYGWAVQAAVQWMCPIIATTVFGLGLLLVFMPANTYLVDVFTVHAASAMAANTVLRSVVAAVLPLAGPPLYRKLGYGWGNSLLGFVSLLMVPIPFLFLRYGEWLRTRFVVKL